MVTNISPIMLPACFTSMFANGLHQALDLSREEASSALDSLPQKDAKGIYLCAHGWLFQSQDVCTHRLPDLCRVSAARSNGVRRTMRWAPVVGIGMQLWTRCKVQLHSPKQRRGEKTHTPLSLFPTLKLTSPDAPWDCHRTVDQARGGARGVNGAASMPVPWSVWDMVPSGS